MNDEPRFAALQARRRMLIGLVGSASALLLSGCDRLSRTTWFPRMLRGAERANRPLQRSLGGRLAMAQEFGPEDLSPEFRSNGTAMPQSEAYQSLLDSSFATWRLEIGGLVQKPQSLSLAELRALPARTQITRHDCVEGWSAIGKWTGVPLATLLATAMPEPKARFVVFHCADPMDDAGTPYYESIDLDDAYHPQTILAYALNDAALPVKNGAPLRLRVERQLGYKQAKYLMRLELVESFGQIAGGQGGYWEDQGYQWYAGI